MLLDAAFDSSPRDLKQNWRAVTALALVAVGLTVVGVALVARWIIPALPWPAAVALGAIVAPPDAAAATAVLRQLRPPHRILVVLQGESLFNDATALLVYRLAVAAAITGSFGGWSAVPMLLAVAAGSVLLGACTLASPHLDRAEDHGRRHLGGGSVPHDVRGLDARRAAAPLGNHHGRGVRHPRRPYGARPHPGAGSGFRATRSGKSRCSC